MSFWASYYEIAGRTLCVEPRDEASAKIFARFIAGYHFAPVAFDERRREPDQTIRISSEGPMPDVPGRMQICNEDNVSCCTDGESYYLQLHDSLIIVRAQTSKSVELWIGDAPQALTSLYLCNVLANAVQIALRRCGVYKLHAAGVVKPASDEGALIIGDTGCGKSTLTIELASHGWRYLSDDALTLCENSDLVEAHGHRRFFALLASGDEKRLPGWAEALGAPFAANADKRWVDPTVLFPNRFAASGIPRALFFPSIMDRMKTTVVKLSQCEAMSLLIRQCPLINFDRPLARQQLRLFAQLVNQSVSYKLMAGRDLLAQRGRAAALFASYM
jgi:hypothetical protein